MDAAMEMHLHYAVQQLSEQHQERWQSVPFGPFPDFEGARTMAERWREQYGNPCRVVLHITVKTVIWEYESPPSPRSGLTIVDNGERGPDDQLYGGP